MKPGSERVKKVQRFRGKGSKRFKEKVQKGSGAQEQVQTGAEQVFQVQVHRITGRVRNNVWEPYRIECGDAEHGSNR